MNHRRRILVNDYERATHEVLKHVSTEYGARVYAKVRTADALSIESSGLTNAEYSYALRSHFDFIVTDETDEVAFAVEFDGPRHQTVRTILERDKLKNRICDKLQLPLLRIDDSYFRKVGRFSVLSWLVEVK